MFYGVVNEAVYLFLVDDLFFTVFAGFLDRKAHHAVAQQRHLVAGGWIGTHSHLTDRWLYLIDILILEGIFHFVSTSCQHGSSSGSTNTKHPKKLPT